MVVDPSGTWLTDLEKMIHKLGVNVMRTPCNIHPSPKALALKYFAKETKREKVCGLLVSFGCVLGLLFP